MIFFFSMDFHDEDLRQNEDRQIQNEVMRPLSPNKRKFEIQNESFAQHRQTI